MVAPAVPHDRRVPSWGCHADRCRPSCARVVPVSRTPTSYSWGSWAWAEHSNPGPRCPTPAEFALRRRRVRPGSDDRRETTSPIMPRERPRLRRWDSNPRPPGYEPSELPLLHGAGLTIARGAARHCSMKVPLSPSTRIAMFDRRHVAGPSTTLSLGSPQGSITKPLPVA